MNTSLDLNLDTSWRIGEEAFQSICAVLRHNRCASMIEFGSGASTIRWALEFPRLRITSIEHDTRFFEETSGYITSVDLEERVELLHCPLTNSWISGRRFTTYRRPCFSEMVDCVLIDGPPASATRRGREACLYFVYDILKVGGIVVLDDALRHDEQRVVKNWLAGYPGSFETSIDPVGHGLAILKKVKHNHRMAIRGQTFVDNFEVLLSEMRSRAGVMLRRIVG